MHNFNLPIVIALVAGVGAAVAASGSLARAKRGRQR
jgi:hypothetical protein